MSIKEVEKDTVIVKSLRPIFFEFYKQGFLFSNFVLNGGLFTSKNDLKNLIIEEFKEFFEQNLEENCFNLQDRNTKKNSKDLNLSDIIANTGESEKVIAPELDKILTTCPLCSKEIYAKDINLEQIDITKINNFPFDYIHVHSHGDFPPHALLMYFDAHFKVRGRKVPKFTNLRV